MSALRHLIGDSPAMRQVLDLVDRVAGTPVTVLLVTHRLPAVGFADRILVLDGGRVRQSGTHAELLGQSGLYRRMYEALGAAGSVESRR